MIEFALILIKYQDHDENMMEIDKQKLTDQEKEEVKFIVENQNENQNQGLIQIIFGSNSKLTRSKFVDRMKNE